MTVRQFRRLAYGALAAMLVALALSAPAPARPPADHPLRSAPVEMRDMSELSEREYLASRGQGAPSVAPRPAASANTPFDWRAAALGAGAAAVTIAVLALAGPHLPPRRRARLHPGRSSS